MISRERAFKLLNDNIQNTNFQKKLASVKVNSITKRMKERAFAASVKRENILECDQLGIPINAFAELALTAMQEISDELGL